MGYARAVWTDTGIFDARSHAKCIFVDLTVEFSREVTETEIIGAMYQWSQIQGGLFAVNEEPLVSIDFNHHPASSIFDATQLMVNGQLVKLLFLV